MLDARCFRLRKLPFLAANLTLSWLPIEILKRLSNADGRNILNQTIVRYQKF